MTPKTLVTSRERLQLLLNQGHILLLILRGFKFVYKQLLAIFFSNKDYMLYQSVVSFSHHFFAERSMIVTRAK